MENVPSNAVMWAGIVGFLMPVVVSVLVQTGWNDRAKSVVAFVSCLIAGAGTAYFSGNFVGQDIVTCALITFTVAIATYYGFWKPSGMAGRIEAATTL